MNSYLEDNMKGGEVSMLSSLSVIERIKNKRCGLEGKILLNLMAIMLSLIFFNGCSDKPLFTTKSECDYYEQLESKKTTGVAIKDNKAISDLQVKIIGCGFNKSCIDSAKEEFKNKHNCKT
ncbi:MAG: hypothetical protein OXJ52_08310 [Oligoflexia bacterium]|nr:hypothetical protein [Oligoflexia bacterium]